MLRRLVLPTAFVLVAAACTSTSDERTADGTDDLVAATCDDDRVVEVDVVESSPAEDVPSALDRRDDERFPPPLVDPDDIRAGGPPPDGIPAIDEPRFVRQCSVDWLGAAEPMLVVDVDGDARAYPRRTARCATARSPTTAASATASSTSGPRDRCTSRRS